MGRTAAVAGGFVLGSIVTIVTLTMLWSNKKEETEFRSREHQSRTRSVHGISQNTSGGFLTNVVIELWKHLNKAGSQTIKETVEPMFAEMLPGPLAGLHFTKVDLGNSPLRLDNILVHSLEPNKLQFDLDVTWNADCDVSLKADYVGSFGISKIQLEGRLCVVLKPLTDVLPVVSAVQYAFCNPPSLKLSFSGLAQVADWSIMQNSVKEVLDQTLASMLVLPNRMLYKLDPACNFMDVYEPPRSIVNISLLSGRGFEVETKFIGKHDIPDVYCNISMSGKTWKTSTIKDSCDPIWNEEEKCDFLLCDLDQIIKVHAWDEDRGALDADDDLGFGEVTVGDVLLAGKSLEVELVNQDYKSTGAFITLGCKVHDFSKNYASSLTKATPSPNTVLGLLTIVVTQAFGIVFPPSTTTNPSSYIEVKFGDQVFVTSEIAEAPGVDAVNPTFDSVFYIPIISSVQGKKVSFVLCHEEWELGTLEVTLDSILQQSELKLIAKEPVGQGGATLEFCISLHAIQRETAEPEIEVAIRSIEQFNDTEPFSEALDDAAQDKIRITIVKGHGFQAKKRRLKKKDIPDVYCNITFGSSPTVWRTETIKDSVEPTWNAFKEYSLLSHNQILTVEAFNENRRGKDDLIGRARIAVGQVILQGTTEVELQSDKGFTKRFITIQCDVL